MTYLEWYESHNNKHKTITNKLLSRGYTKEQIIEYFDFDNMVKHEKDFCLLYQENKKCHDVSKLNCYLCACPHFRFKDEGIKKVEGKTQYSYCDIDSKNGSLVTYGDAIHQDCFTCNIPHTTKYISDNFDLEWDKIMQKCRL